MPASTSDPAHAVRRFNRFYTRQIGLLDEGLLHSPFSLTEVRLMYELAHRPGITATEIREILALDAGYLSRILRGLRRQGLVTARAPAADRRRRELALTERGRRTFDGLDARSSEEVAGMLARLSRGERRELVEAMRGVERLLGKAADGPAPGSEPIIRGPRPGELGWVVKRHGELYSAEYGWDSEFEALVAGIVGQFAAEHDRRVERCWIAELWGEPAGSVFLVKEDGRDRPAAAAARRTVGARARGRDQAGGRVPAIRPGSRVPPDDAVDQRRPPRGAADLPAGGVPARGGGEAPQLRARSGEPDVGARAVSVLRVTAGEDAYNSYRSCPRLSLSRRIAGVSHGRCMPPPPPPTSAPLPVPCSTPATASSSSSASCSAPASSGRRSSWPAAARRARCS